MEKENKENASLMEFTFEPRIKLNPRYPIHTPMEERHKSWYKSEHLGMKLEHSTSPQSGNRSSKKKSNNAPSLHD